MKKTTFFYLLTILVTLLVIIGCGDLSKSRKDGELYGKCYSNETCNEGLECDTEHNTCVKRRGDGDAEIPADNDEEDSENTETSDIDSTTVGDTDITDREDTLSDDDTDTGETNREECNPYEQQFKCIGGNSYFCSHDYEGDSGYFWTEIETCIFF